ncbi:hypothetical protein [Vibrio sp. HA2012]|nr:hypothetical protein [Vibrio sp. HA2012]
MSTILSSQVIGSEVKAPALSAVKEIAGILTLFAYVALPVFLLSLTWM